jgi:hypothetical protein
VTAWEHRVLLAALIFNLFFGLHACFVPILVMHGIYFLHHLTVLSTVTCLFCTYFGDARHLFSSSFNCFEHGFASHLIVFGIL